MKNYKKLIKSKNICKPLLFFTILLFLLQLSFINILAFEGDLLNATQEQTYETQNISNNDNELKPMMASGCYTDASNLSSLFNGLGIPYSGTGNNIVLGGGYNYNYNNSGSYWSVYVTGPNGFSQLYRVASLW